MLLICVQIVKNFYCIFSGLSMKRNSLTALANFLRYSEGKCNIFMAIGFCSMSSVLRNSSNNVLPIFGRHLEKFENAAGTETMPCLACHKHVLLWGMLYNVESFQREILPLDVSQRLYVRNGIISQSWVTYHTNWVGKVNKGLFSKVIVLPLLTTRLSSLCLQCTL